MRRESRGGGSGGKDDVLGLPVSCMGFMWLKVGDDDPLDSSCGVFDLCASVAARVRNSAWGTGGVDIDRTWFITIVRRAPADSEITASDFDFSI